MSKNELRSSGKHQRCDFANGACELLHVKRRWERKIWSEYQLTPFENRQFYAVKDTDGYLSHEYGDYMKLPSKEQQMPKHDFIAVYWKD